MIDTSSLDKVGEYIEQLEEGGKQARKRVIELVDEKNKLEKENENLNDYWNITQRTMKDYEDMIDELVDKLNKIKDLFNKRDMTGKDEFLEELRDLLSD